MSKRRNEIHYVKGRKVGEAMNFKENCQFALDTTDVLFRN